MKNRFWKFGAGRTIGGDFVRGCIACGLLVLTVTVVLWGFPGSAPADDGSILGKLNTIVTVTSTVPLNGDINPYGVAQVKFTTGKLKAGDVLVSNFNNGSNLQGTGSTIVDVSSSGTSTLFSQVTASTLPGACPGGIGLTTALVVLKSGWVIVGSLPTTDGSAATAEGGCLIVLDSMGNPVETIFGTLINGPWDMTVYESGNEAKLFVTNVLNGTVEAGGGVVNGGTVVRIDLQLSGTNVPWVESMTVIGSGFAERTDPAALVIGPTGVGIGRRGNDHRWDGDEVKAKGKDKDKDKGKGKDKDKGKGDDQGEDQDQGQDQGRGDNSILYVADSLNNGIQMIDHALTRTSSAGTGKTLTSGGSLNDPLGLVVAPNGHILTVNGNDGFITEITPKGDQIASKLLDNSGSPPGAGALFGLAFDPKMGIFFVDDATNTLNLLRK